MPGTVAGVASERDVLILEADADADELLHALDDHHVAGKQLHISSDPAHLTLVISRENLHDEARVQSAFMSRFGDRLRFIAGLGAVSVIGAGINASYANARSGLAALRDAGVESRGMSTSSFRITWMVPSDGVTAAVRALHARFIEAARAARAMKIATWNVNGIRARQGELQAAHRPRATRRAVPAGDQGVDRADSDSGSASSRATGAIGTEGRATPASHCTCVPALFPIARNFTIPSSTTSIASSRLSCRR